jgi:hypothetical protein
MLNNSMKQRPSAEPVISTASQEFPWVSQHMKVRYRVFKSPPLVPVLNKINSVTKETVSAQVNTIM